MVVHSQKKKSDIKMIKSHNLKIGNIVVSTRIAAKLDLDYVETKLKNAATTKGKFPGLVYRMKKPKTAFLIFRSGKIICTGSKTKEDVKLAIDLLAADLRSIGIKTVDHPDLKVQNIVASAHLRKEVNLAKVLECKGTEYEPEIFPGLICRIDEPKSVILVFSSGRLVITGCKTIEDCEKAVEVLQSNLSLSWFNKKIL